VLTEGRASLVQGGGAQNEAVGVVVHVGKANTVEPVAKYTQHALPRDLKPHTCLQVYAV
jgi:hypothetical protein